MCSVYRQLNENTKRNTKFIFAINSESWTLKLKTKTEVERHWNWEPSLTESNCKTWSKVDRVLALFEHAFFFFFFNLCLCSLIRSRRQLVSLSLAPRPCTTPHVSRPFCNISKMVLNSLLHFPHCLNLQPFLSLSSMGESIQDEVILGRGHVPSISNSETKQN